MWVEYTLVTVFVLSVAVLVHTYFLYPLSLIVLNKVTNSEYPRAKEELPTVALVIAAYNEEEIIEQKIQNSLDLTYPDELLNIIVFSDASDDDTDDIVREYENEGVTLKRIEGRVGKTVCQNEVAKTINEEIIVFSDANSMYEPDAIEKIVEKFSDNVGCVVGELKYKSESNVEGESFYWRYESLIKRLESRFHSLVTGNGSIYAIKSADYVPQPANAVSDFTGPLSILRQGKLVKYAPSAVAWEKTGDSEKEEYNRRVRIITRSWNSIVQYLDLLNIFKSPKIAYELWSHKIFRWFSPVLLGVALVSNGVLVVISDNPLYTVTLWTQLLFYSMGCAGYIFERRQLRNPSVTYIPYYFLYSNLAMLRGMLNFVQGTDIVTWETTQRD